MKIAVIGSGISGLTCAWLLSQKHEVWVYESNDRIGGHTATVDIEHSGQRYAIDTGFIVFNDWTYPNFIKLMNTLGIKSQASNMSFSVSAEGYDYEYSGSSFKALFAQKRNLFNFSHWKMLRDIVRFNKRAIRDYEAGAVPEGMTLNEYLQKLRMGQYFTERYLIPMASAIWSSSNESMLDVSALFFIEFFKNHGLLNIKNRPQWRVLKGGSKAYLEPLSREFRERIVLNSKITAVKRTGDSAKLLFVDGTEEDFDQVVLACHSDQALSLLGDVNPTERLLLASIPYKKNHVVLHTDTSVLPKRSRAWASWNYRLSADKTKLPALSYNMNMLQGFGSDHTFIVTLNASEHIDPDKILGEFYYSHPQFSLKGREAQRLWEQINGKNRTWFCGAYWGSGFHEDGCVSGIRVAKALGCEWEL